MSGREARIGGIFALAGDKQIKRNAAQAGDTLEQPGLVAALAELSADSATVYRGSIGESLLGLSDGRGGSITRADLAAYERENEAFYSDAEVMDGWRRLWQYVVQGSIQDELLEEAPRIA